MAMIFSLSHCQFDSCSTEATCPVGQRDNGKQQDLPQPRYAKLSPESYNHRIWTKCKDDCKGKSMLRGLYLIPKKCTGTALCNVEGALTQTFEANSPSRRSALSSSSNTHHPSHHLVTAARVS